MRDCKKFCRPNLVKYPKAGDIIILLPNGLTGVVTAKEYESIKSYFLKVGDYTPNSEENNQPQVDPYNGHEYVDLGLPSGTKWATMNVGASSITDYGNYYQYGKGADTYQVTSGQSNYSGTENPLAASVDTATVEWGGQWHMPTQTQLNELIANTTYQWVTNYQGSGVDGGTFTANGQTLFIPAAGCYNNGSISNVGVYGLVWSSTPDGESRAHNLEFRSNGKYVSVTNRFKGDSVRPVID